MIISGLKQRQIPPPGTYTAYLAWWIELGTQFYEGEWEWKFSTHWELTETRATFKKERGPEPFLLGKEITAYIGKRANMRKIAEAMFGRSLTGAEVASFDTEKIRTCGKPLMVPVSHETGRDSETYPIITGFAPVRKGAKVPAPVLPTLHYRIEDGTGGDFVKLPSWIQDKILASRELSGDRPTKSEIIERNVRQAAANATAEPEPDDSDEPDDVFDLDAYSDEELRKPEIVKEIREIIENLPCSNAEKANQFRYLNQLVRRANTPAAPPDFSIKVEGGLSDDEAAEIDEINKKLAAEFTEPDEYDHDNGPAT